MNSKMILVAILFFFHSISDGEFVSVPELKENPLVKRVVDIFDSDLNGEVDRDTVSQILQKSAISRTKRSAEKECLVVSTCLYYRNCSKICKKCNLTGQHTVCLKG